MGTGMDLERKMERSLLMPLPNCLGFPSTSEATPMTSVPAVCIRCWMGSWTEWVAWDAVGVASVRRVAWDDWAWTWGRGDWGGWEGGRGALTYVVKARPAYSPKPDTEYSTNTMQQNEMHYETLYSKKHRPLFTFLFVCFVSVQRQTHSSLVTHILP